MTHLLFYFFLLFPKEKFYFFKTFFYFFGYESAHFRGQETLKIWKVQIPKKFHKYKNLFILSIWLQYDYSMIIVKIRENELIKFSGIPDPFSDVFIHFHRTYLFVDFKNFLITENFSKTMRKNINFPSGKPLFRSLSYRWLWDSSRRSLKTIDFCTVWTYWYENLCD